MRGSERSAAVADRATGPIAAVRSIEPEKCFPRARDPATQSIVDTPSKTIQRANRLVDEHLERWVTCERRRAHE
jgi:hypothetical protein